MSNFVNPLPPILSIILKKKDNFFFGVDWKVYIEFVTIYCFCFTFCDHEACGILSPWPRIEPAPPALEGEVLTTARKVWKYYLKKKKKSSVFQPVALWTNWAPLEPGKFHSAGDNHLHLYYSLHVVCFSVVVMYLILMMGGGAEV